jgi:hypothetical protein
VIAPYLGSMAPYLDALIDNMEEVIPTLPGE